MNEEARIAELADLPGEELDALRAVTENDSLRNIKLGEESVQAVKLLSFFEEGVKLSKTLESELISDLDVLGLRNITLLELTNLNWVCGAEESDLTIIWHHLKYLLNDFLELARDQSIDLVKHTEPALIEFGLIALR